MPHPKFTHTLAGLTALLLLAQSPAQTMATPPPADGAQQSVPQLDRVLAPVALYPDALLAQILMAATYPLEVVQADRWRRLPANAALKGDALVGALEQQPWDPSIKSLVPFPQILRMMDDNLSWTSQLGDAFLAGQPAVMDAVQRLRRASVAAGTLQSNAQERIVDQHPVILIEQPDPAVVYIPVYDPATAYGAWPYPDAPPYYFPGYYGGAIGGGLGFGWFGVGIDLPLWGWGTWDWGGHGIDIDRGRFNRINGGRPGLASGTWQHDPAHRGHVPYADAGNRTRYQGGAEAARGYRGYAGAAAPAAHEQASPRTTQLHGGPPTQSYRAERPASPAFESFGRGADVRAQAGQGHMSRSSMPSFAHQGMGGQPHGSGGSGGRSHR